MGIMMPYIAVQVISYCSKDAEEDLKLLISSLERVRYPQDRWELIFIDNPSPQGMMRGWIEATVLPKAGVTLPRVRLLCSDKNDGFAGGHQRGYEARSAETDVLFLLNQDAYIEPDTITHAVAAFDDSHIALVQSQIRLAQDPSRLNVLGNCLHFLGFGFSDGNGQTPAEASRSRLPHFFGSGAALFVRVQALEPYGYLFDPVYFMYHEDVDLSWRMRLLGFDIAFPENSIAYHRYEFSRSTAKFVWMEQNRWRTHLSRLKWRTLLVFMPAWVLMELGALVFAARSGYLGKRLFAYRFFFDPNVWSDIKKRRLETRRLRLHTDRDMLAMMVGRLTSQEVENVLLKYLVNPLLNVYFRGLLRFIVW
ncbi:hypothetical protein A3B32_01405 [Candidatus Uhrbacteria bacterium RIFCSPLOWO2_01_FULL_53_9]|uniref:Glycosyltransferase 2-like domain-containing protein n=3 Tax=Candidatus Uhriibacteriota TaxID=1752732 RepID=A0A1F7UYW4_9BACT|nr:MAG: hypothetical protein A3B32_01405 [Candidatus Uhrbacteria bacterium RIFCSPLOWO2_01_FULL_53_9]